MKDETILGIVAIVLGVTALTFGYLAFLNNSRQSAPLSKTKLRDMGINV